MANTEIERKFLVRDKSYRALATHSHHICQGYLCQDPARTVRIRIKDDKGFITIKSLADSSGMSRYEFEQQIDSSQAATLLNLCLPTPISKTRYYVPWGEVTVEVDEFEDENEGLIMAEIELQSVGQQITLPPFLAKEVTGDERYYNLYLAQKPYKTWER